MFYCTSLEPFFVGFFFFFGGGGASHNIMIHTQKTPSVTCETLIIFPLFPAVSSKQHTINTICM